MEIDWAIDRYLRRAQSEKSDWEVVKKRIHSYFYHNMKSNCVRLQMSPSEASERGRKSANNAVDRAMQIAHEFGFKV